MGELALLLQILTAANAATPTIVGFIDIIRKGREDGETDDQIQAKSMAFAEETRAITEKDMGDQP